MLAPLRRWLPLVLLTLAALWLRTHDLARRPMHADEANQAVKTGELLETGRYVFDPHDHHGPTLYYAALPIARIRGETTLAELSETSLRLVPALFGTLSVALLYAFAAGTQNPKLKTQNLFPFLAAAFLAVSPPAVYYSRYFVQETLLLAFVLATFLAAQRWWSTGRLAWAIVAGLSAGLAQATKATAPLFLIAAATALVAARPARPAAPRLTRPIALALFSALAVAALFYTSFGTNLPGLRDAFTTYADALSRGGAGASGHEKPWWYYLQLFTRIREGGLTFEQFAFTTLAFAGLVLSFTPIASSALRAFLRRAAAYTLAILAAFSLTPYKTPWHAIHLVPGFALLAAGALTAIPRAWLALPVALAVLTFQFNQTKLTSFLRAPDARNPYAYVHSSPDVLKFRALAEAAHRKFPDAPIRVISEEYWPLPWYLRALPNIGYWNSPPADCDGALVIASQTLAETVSSRLTGRYRESYLGLRPGFLCVVFTPEP